MIVHLFAGSKGGIGKTRCSISVSLYYLFEKHYEIGMFDANSNNIDFFTIMTGVDYTSTLFEDDSPFYRQKVVPIKKAERTKNKKKQEIIKELNSHCYIRKHPFELYNGVNDFWREVHAVVKDTKEQKRKHLIVDTNLAIPNLISVKDDSRENTRQIFNELSDLGVKKILIWYVWCLNDFLGIRKSLNYTISRMMMNLEAVSNGLFSVKSNLIHVLNPYLFFKRRSGLFEFITKIGKEIDLQNSIEVLEKTGLPFDLAIKIFAFIIKQVIEKIPSVKDVKLAELIENVIDINQKPLNFVVLEQSKENVYYIKDQLISSSFSDNESGNSRVVRDYKNLHKGEFGKNTLWKKLKMFESVDMI